MPIQPTGAIPRMFSHASLYMLKAHPYKCLIMPKCVGVLIMVQLLVLFTCMFSSVNDAIEDIVEDDLYSE
jgi:hypothetical protein